MKFNIEGSPSPASTNSDSKEDQNLHELSRERSELRKALQSLGIKRHNPEKDEEALIYKEGI